MNKPVNFRIFYGNSNIPLVEKVTKKLGKCEGVICEFNSIKLRSFADGEFWCQLKKSCRGQDVNDNYMELFLITDALRRASAKKITAIIPYFGRVPISGALMSTLLEASGVDRVVSVDLHCGQIQGFFNNRVPVDNLYGRRVLIEGIVNSVKFEKNKVCVVSPDAGGAERCDSFRLELEKKLGCKVRMALMNKHREEVNKVTTMELIGGTLIKDLDCIIVDDMADTCGTLCKCADVLKSNGAKKIYSCVTHGLFNGTAIERIEKSKIEKIFVTDTIPLKKASEKVVVVSVADLIVDVIKRVYCKDSISILFKTPKKKK